MDEVLAPEIFGYITTDYWENYHMSGNTQILSVHDITIFRLFCCMLKCVPYGVPDFRQLF